MLRAAKATRETGTEAEKLQQKREAFNTIGTAALATGAAMVTMSALAAKAAISWESAWAGVTKTVDGTPKQLAEVEAGLRGLTAVLPSSHEEIAAVAEAAGQLGVATPNVVQFTRTMIDLGQTTNLSANDAATALARFMNIMGTAQADVSNLGSALVGLGNNYATTEREILEMAMRLAGAGKQIGLTEGQVLGLSTALSSVGIEAEAGGSAMSKVMIDIAANVESGGEKLEKFAAAAGMSAQKFSQQWKKDPAQALALFVKGLADAESQGASTLGVLADLGITEVRMRDALLRSASAADQFASAMAMGNDEFEANNALTDEAAKRYETVEAKLAIASNAIREAAISFGQVLLPAIAEAAGGVQEFASFLADLPEPVMGFLSVAGTAVGALTAIAGATLLAVPKLADFKTALETLEISTDGVSGKLGKLAKVGAGAVAGFAIATAGADLLTEAFRNMGDAAETTDNKVMVAATAAELFNAAMGKGFGATDNIEAAAEGVAGLAEMLDRAKAGAQGLDGVMNGRGVLFASNAVLRLGAELGELAQRDLPAAQEKFRMLTSEAKLNDDQIATLIDMMEPFKKALTEQGTAAEKSAQGQDILNLALGGTPGAAAGAEAALTALKEESDEAEAALAGVASALDDVGGAAMSLGEAKDAALSAINAMTAAAEAEGAAIDGADDASIRLRDSIRSVETAHRDSARAIIESGGTVAEAQAEWERGRQTIIGMLEAKGIDATEAAVWADAQLGSAAQVKASIDEVYQAWLNLPENRETKYQVEAAEALRKLQALQESLASIPEYRRITLETFSYGNKDVTANESGAIHTYRAFANGGIASNLPSGIYPGGAEIHKFAEKTLPWEAYISPKPDQRERNYGVWQESGRRLGFLGDGGEQSPSAEQIGAAVAAAMREYPQIAMAVHNPVTRDPFADMDDAAGFAALR